MVIEESYGEGMVRTVSDNGVLIRKLGTDELYSEAIDLVDSDLDYVETDIPIEEVADNEHDASEGDNENVS